VQPHRAADGFRSTCTVTIKLITEPQRRGRLNSDVAPCCIMSTVTIRLVTEALLTPKRCRHMTIKLVTDWVVMLL
jgi:hypothetical protein